MNHVVDSSHVLSCIHDPFYLLLQLGAGMVIKGWDEGLTNMCEGEKRKLTIPAGKVSIEWFCSFPCSLLEIEGTPLILPLFNEKDSLHW